MMRLILFTFFASLTATAFCQIKMVSVGAGYSDQAYVNLTSDKIQTISNEDWDIAFSNIGQQDAGIHINESASLMGAELELYHTNAIDWEETYTPSDSLENETRLFNDEKSWERGAFNSFITPGDPLDYGWGRYNPMVQAVQGDDIYVLKQRNGELIKLQIVKADFQGYEIRYANLDNSNEKSAIIPRIPGNPLLYFSIENEEVITVEPDYDLVFTRYSKPLEDFNNGGLLDYVVMGVLLAPGTEAVVANGVDPTNISHDDYFNSYSANVDTIGHTWKNFDLNEGGWIVYDDRAQFVKTKTGEIYLIAFFDFEGSSTGITTFLSAPVGTTSTDENSLINNQITVYPNPVADQINIELDGNNLKEAILYDQNGKMVLTSKSTQIELDQSILSGQYFLLVISDNEPIVKSLYINK